MRLLQITWSLNVETFSEEYFTGYVKNCLIKFFYFVEDEFTECLQQNPDERLELQQMFEIKKRSTGERTSREFLAIVLPECIRRIPEFERKLEKSTKYPKIRVRRGKVEFPLEMIKDLFKEPIHDVTSQINQLLVNNSVDAIILVGGFSESQLVYKSIKEKIKKKIQPSVLILNPPDCGLSVLKGAVLFGFKPQQISKRVSRYSYGFSISKPFDSVLHNNERDRVHKHYDNLEDVFSAIVRAGDSVFPNEVREYKCRPAERGPGFSLVEFYATLDNDPKYVKEPESFIPKFCCHHIGDIKIEHGRQGNLENNEINVQVVFGFTQLNVTAECTISGIRNQVTARFELLK